jgi:hypothetical protein
VAGGLGMGCGCLSMWEVQQDVSRADKPLNQEIAQVQAYCPYLTDSFEDNVQHGIRAL